MNFLKDGLSVDEAKVSTLVIAFFITIVAGIYQIYQLGDIQTNTLTLLMYEIIGITGVNVAKHFSSTEEAKG